MPPRARSKARSASTAQPHLQHPNTAPNEGVEDETSTAAFARLLREAVLKVPGVTRVGTTGAAGPSTYGLRGEVIRGVRITREPNGVTVEIHITTQLVPLQALAESVRSAVRHAAAKLDSLQVDVVIDALEAP